jgi:hypothetical protein
MTAETPRRGMIRKIADLPAYPGGAAIQEVEIAGVPYQATAGGSAGISSINQTVIQLPLSNFLDIKQHSVGVFGSVAIDNTTTPSSALFTGGGGVISVGQGSPFNDLDISAANYTIEAFFKTTQAAQLLTTICERDNGSFGSGSWSLLINADAAGDGKIAFYSSSENNASAVMTSTVGGYNDGVRHHVVVCRIGEKYQLWVDGTIAALQIFNGFSAPSPVLTAPVRVGNSAFASRQFIGNIDNFRYIIGINAYAGFKFTVPSVPFPTT